MTDNQQLLEQYHGNWIVLISIILVCVFCYLYYSNTMKKTNEEILSQAKEFLNRLSVKGTLDYRDRSHVIEVNNFMIRHGEDLKTLSHNLKPNLYAVLLGFLDTAESYLGMKVYKDSER